MTDSSPVYNALEDQGGPGVNEELWGKIQAAISLTSELTATWQRNGEERARALQAAADSADRNDRERVQAQHRADEPLMRQVWQGRWWQEAGAEEIGDIWEITASWAAQGDPSGIRNLEKMRQQIKKIHGIDMDPVPIDSALVAQVLATTPGTQEDRPAGEGPPVAYIIKDAQGNVVDQGSEQLPGDEGRPPGIIASDLLLKFTTGPDTGAGPYSITIMDRTRPQGERTFAIAQDAAEQLRPQYDQWAKRVLNGEQDTPLDRLRDLLRVERRRLRDAANADPSVAQVAVWEALAKMGGDRPEDPATARHKLGYIDLRLRMVEAQLRGEDPGVVVQATLVGQQATDQWWSTAEPEEIRSLFAQVNGWADGQAKKDLQERLRDDGRRILGEDALEELLNENTPEPEQGKEPSADRVADGLEETVEPPSEGLAPDSLGDPQGATSEDLPPAADSPGAEPYGFSELAIKEQDRTAARALRDLGDPELAEAVQAAQTFGYGQPPTSLLNTGKAGLGKRAPNRRGAGQGLDLSGSGAER